MGLMCYGHFLGDEMCRVIKKRSKTAGVRLRLPIECVNKTAEQERLL